MHSNLRIALVWDWQDGWPPRMDVMVGRPCDGDDPEMWMDLHEHVTLTTDEGTWNDAAYAAAEDAMLTKFGVKRSDPALQILRPRKTTPSILAPMSHPMNAVLAKETGGAVD